MKDDRVRCPRCNGSGDLYAYDWIARGSRTSCDYCEGIGKVSQTKADCYTPPNYKKETSK